LGHRGSLVERDLPRAAAALRISVASRVVDEDASHYLSRDGEEVRAVGPLNVSLIDEPDVSFVDQSRGLQSVTFALTAHVAARKAMEFVVDKRIQLIERGLVSFTPRGEELGYLMFLSGRIFLHRNKAGLSHKLRDVARLA
jgi:hypothetical protein